MLRPLGDRIIVKAALAEDVTAGGIVLPDSAKEKPQEGEAIAVGPGAQLDSGKKAPLDVKVGDRVIYGKYAGTEVKVDSEELVILRQEDVLAIREDKKKKK
ncbi:MAG: co-chaperone GroES [Armatimonadetes bacterium RBG_16_58_9]|nr:MAG: co-chaperone GroES [Armatimonadetes bacterium RBG_16_58_9]